MVPSKLFLKGGPLQVQVLSTSENAVPRHPSVIHIQKSDKMTLFSKVFLTWAACLENDYFFFWVMSCGISHPFVVSPSLSLWRQETQIQIEWSERLLPRHGICQIAGWRGLQQQCLQRNWVFCQSAPSILYSQNNLNVVPQPCAISRSAQTCTFSALQITAHTALKQGCLGEGNVPLPSPGKTRVPSTPSC